MLFDTYSVRSRLGHTVSVRVSRGLRTRPLLTMILLGIAAFACLLAVVAVAVTTLAAIAVAAVAFVAYNTVRQLLRPRRPGHNGAALRAGERPADQLRRYLSAVDEFGRLTELAMAQPIDGRPRATLLRRMTEDARQLQSAARGLAESWRGGNSPAACMFELRAGADSLLDYLRELSRDGSRRASDASLRWKRDDLSRRRDALTSHLRNTDFRTAATEAMRS
jgi:hypothetical protein